MHKNITILTICKIYNVNNNKTADICFYHYFDEVIYVKKKIQPTPGLKKKYPRENF